MLYAVSHLKKETDGDILEITLEAKGIGSTGMLGIGFGGLTMAAAEVSDTFHSIKHD